MGRRAEPSAQSVYFGLPALMAAYPGFIRNGLRFLTRVLCPRSHPGARWRGGDKTRRVRIPNWNEGSHRKRTLRSTLIPVDFY